MAEVLDIGSCDLEFKYNNEEHHTDLNGVDRLIVRRGQPFTLTLHLQSGTFQPAAGTFQLIAETGPVPEEKWGTKATFGLSDVISKKCWSASTSCSHGNIVSLSICPSPAAPIGRYTLTLDQGPKVKLGEFVLLFNPWCARDVVYLEDEEKRTEYVLSQDGLIYRGTPTHLNILPWNFGQFEPGMLDACLRILDENPKHLKNPGKDCSGRRNAVYVTRVLSAMINCNGDKGVLAGNWSGDYKGGVAPTHWSSSVEILQEWRNNDCCEVCYGQCWVFAAVACTVSRALGIPCRVITNFESAHDTNHNLLIEFYYNMDRERSGEDSVWNFHVWVETWMKRPDLGPGYEGWQASDPTPQEKSDGVFCCGPVPLKAIKEGELTLKYDAPFVFAEVNADVVKYVKLEDGQEFKFDGSTTRVGQCISTKSVGHDSREDITDLYKYPEGSQQERQVFEKAGHHNALREKGLEPGLKLKIKVSADMKRGYDFDVFAVITNNTPVTKTCRLLYNGHGVSYDGKLKSSCGLTEIPDLQVSTGEEKSFPLKICYCNYSSVITQDALIRLMAILIDSDTKELYNKTRTIVLEDPEISIRILGEPKVKRKLTAEISLQNPLPEPLEDCTFSLEGANLTDGKAITETFGTVGPRETATVKIGFTPTCAGLRKLVVDFSSNKLSNIKGFKNVIIGN
ncbi:protein-glutamine gamma-glutamyltransferase 2-like [Conger conger]|uniref:protein-glutamine gamma-glutamyltransferase 2-like n=1 Tax=Conger conger TaxID=82655 RepID=UPI002A5A3B7C|nr:protein-glutamine gamma-glutamyltransferase 2-like [Conger conger]